MATFGLVHGAWHGAWCWDLLVPELEFRGHAAIAMDLPCEDREATFFDYAETVSSALLDSSDVVLVGHSLAGMTIPLVALRRPIRMLDRRLSGCDRDSRGRVPATDLEQFT